MLPSREDNLHRWATEFLCLLEPDDFRLPDGALLLCRRQSCESETEWNGVLICFGGSSEVIYLSRIRGSVRQRPARVLDGPDSPGTHRGRLADACCLQVVVILLTASHSGSMFGSPFDPVEVMAKVFG